MPFGSIAWDGGGIVIGGSTDLPFTVTVADLPTIATPST